MTNYISRTGGQKKKNILRQKELALRGDIRLEVPIEKLHRSAEKVRTAQLGVVKALSHEAQPARTEDEDASRPALKKLEETKDYWTEVSVQEIIQIYADDPDKSEIIDSKKW